MLGYLTSNSKHIVVNKNNWSNYINYGSLPGIGNVRFIPQSNRFEVYDGNNWNEIKFDTAQVHFSGEAEKAMDWAITKMLEDQYRTEMAKQHPAVAIALEKVKEAEQQLQTTIELSRQYETN